MFVTGIAVSWSFPRFLCAGELDEAKLVVCFNAIIT